MNTKQLKQFIQNQVFDILSDIKQQIEIKMKDIDQNILLMKKEITSILKNNNNNKENVSQKTQTSYVQLENRMQLVQKQIQILKQKQLLLTNSFQNGPYNNTKNINLAKANYSTSTTSNNLNLTNQELIKTLPFKKQAQNYRYTQNHNQGQKQTFYQSSNLNDLNGLAKNNSIKKQISKPQNRSALDNNSASNNGGSPHIFKRTSENSFDLSSLLFDELEDDSNTHLKKNQVSKQKFYIEKQSNQRPGHKIEQLNKNMILHSHDQQYQNNKKINSQAEKPQINMSKIVSPLSYNNKQKKPPLPNLKKNHLPYQLQENKKQLPAKIVEKQLIKNKNSFMRKKQNNQSDKIIEEEEGYLQESQQINVELDYSKDSMDNFNMQNGHRMIGLKGYQQNKY